MQNWDSWFWLDMNLTHFFLSINSTVHSRCYLHTLWESHFFTDAHQLYHLDVKHVFVDAPTSGQMSWQSTDRLTDTTVKWETKDCRPVNIVQENGFTQEHLLQTSTTMHSNDSKPHFEVNVWVNPSYGSVTLKTGVTGMHLPPVICLSFPSNVDQSNFITIKRKYFRLLV